MSAISAFVEFITAASEFVQDMFGCCEKGGKHCEHYDYTSGAVTFYRCCKCKQRSSMHIDHLEPPM